MSGCVIAGCKARVSACRQTVSCTTHTPTPSPRALASTIAHSHAPHSTTHSHPPSRSPRQLGAAILISAGVMTVSNSLLTNNSATEVHRPADPPPRAPPLDAPLSRSAAAPFTSSQACCRSTTARSRTPPPRW